MVAWDSIMTKKLVDLDAERGCETYQPDEEKPFSTGIKTPNRQIADRNKSEEIGTSLNQCRSGDARNR